MISGLQHALRTRIVSACRWTVAAVLVLFLALSPLMGALTAHHMDDSDSASAMTQIGDLEKTSPEATTRLAAAKDVQDHPANVPVVDHDCHGCSTAVLDWPALTPSAYRPEIVVATSDDLVRGRAPNGEFRPPKA